MAEPQDPVTIGTVVGTHGVRGTVRVRATGETLVLDRADLDAPGEDEFYVGDLVGLAAVNEEGERLGEVTETFETAAHEVLVVRTEEGDVLVPFTLEHVPGVDLGSGRVSVRPPE